MLSEVIERCRLLGTLAGARDAVIFALMGYAGVRRGELIALRFEDCGECYVQTRDRVVMLGGEEHTLLQEYLTKRGTEPGPLFWPIFRSGRIRKSFLSPTTARDILLRRSDRKISPRIMRNLYLQYLAKQGYSISKIMALAGFKSADAVLRHLVDE